MSALSSLPAYINVSGKCLGSQGPPRLVSTVTTVAYPHQQCEDPLMSTSMSVSPAICNLDDYHSDWAETEL